MYHIAHEPTTAESYDITLYCTLFLSALLIPHKNIVPQSHHFYISFFSQPLEVNLYWSPVLEGGYLLMKRNETKRNETKRSQLPVNHSLTYVNVCTYSDLLFCHTNPTPLLPYPPSPLLKANDDLEKGGGRPWKSERDHPRMHPRICSGERRAPILVSLRESSWASPPRGPSLIGCHKPKWHYLLQTELPPPEMPCPNSIAYRRHYYYLMIQSAPLPHTHTHTHTNTVTS